jgi:excisionase family DNA binding protein
MPDTELLSPRQVSEYLSTSAGEVSRLVKDGKLTAYRIGGTYLRFKREEVLSFRKNYLEERQRTEKSKQVIKKGVAPSSNRLGEGVYSISFSERVGEFWYFNSFYVYSIGVMGVLFYFILR